MSSSSSSSFVPPKSSTTVIITGGGGFLGQCLATSLLQKGSLPYDNIGDHDRKQQQQQQHREVPITKLVLVDIFFPPTLQPAIEDAIQNQSESTGVIKVIKLQGDISDTDFCQSLLLSQVGNNDDDDGPSTTTTTTAVSIFHLGAVMSGDGERDFDLAIRVNLQGFMNILDAARQYKERTNSSRTVKVVFTSAGATIGSGADTDYISQCDTISDSSRATPHTTYGATKACCELLLADYARRGFVDGRGVRLPTIVVRAGKPNAATTSCFSSVVREPLSGTDVSLPIASHVPHAVTGMRAAVQALQILHDAPLSQIEQVLGYDRTVFLPAVALSLGDLQQALYNVVSNECRDKLGKITYEVDENLSAVVGSFPTKIDAYRARLLGVPPPPDAETVVREYMTDFASAVADGIEMRTRTTDDTQLESGTKTDNKKVAVITGGGSGIGQAVAQRLVRGGWIVVLVGRTARKLEATQQLLLKEASYSTCLCIQADVSREKDVDRIFQTVKLEYGGRLDLLFNNAGVNSAQAKLPDVSFDDFERVIQTNVSGPFLCARAAMRLMAKSGGGRIINNGSISAHVPRPGSSTYTTSKHAINGLTKCIALDGRAINVACGQIDFGNVVSKMASASNPAGRGALQADGSYIPEPSMSITDAAEAVWTMANLPLEANVLQMTVMASGMPFVGRG